uniref:C3H1-type domain-containing protein n=1 Tax=Lutzomyia longipalpis TaxID=7200 RepID=A0A1B0CRL6_LUTLO
MASMVDASGEREEGEIVENTEYEDISSDEEFSLRLRIEELEARNFELEQIANISGFATDPYDLNAGKGADHVGKENLQKHRSRSNEELRTPRRTHRTAMRSIRTHPVSKRKRDKSQKSTKRRKKRRPSVSSSDSGSFLDREQLDRALNRSVDSSNDVIEIPVEIPVITIDDDDNDEDEDVLKLRLEALQSKQEIKDVLPEVIATQTTPVEPDEQELRLIALKSAVVNKHEARKKRRAQECPYSPTDDLECLPVESPAVVKVDDCSMDISPLESPVIILDNSCVEVDMEISSDTQEIPPQKIQPPAGNAIPEFIVPDVGESEDEMTLRNLLLSEMKKPPEDPESPADGNLEEDCLRSLLLSSIKKPKTPPAVSDGEEPIKADALQPKGDAEKQPKDAPEKLPEAPKKPENVPLEKIEKTTGRRSALVTDFPAFKVTPLIIKLGESESEAEELGEGEGDGKDFDVDNKSPSSLVMESPCDSPASPAAAALPTAAAAATQNEDGATAVAAPGHVFQDKLDLFLKQARSNVEKNSPPQKTKPAKLPKTPLVRKGADHVGKENLQKHRSRSNEELRTPRRTHRTAMRSIRTHPVSKRKRDKSQKSTKRRKKRRPSVSSSDSGSFLDREQLDRALNRSVDSSNDVIEIPVEIPVITIDDDDNDEDEDVLKLRLEALQSKQEIKDVLPEVIATQTTPVEPDEQELRLIALKSVVVNKHEARKKRRAQECPYSPTDDLECLPVESPAVVKVDDCSMDISPLESPVIVLDNSCVEVDMEISSDTQEIPPQKIQPPAGNAIPEFIVPDVGESEDEMTLRNLLLSEMKKPPEDPESPADGNLEEDCLRSLLLSSIKKPKTPPAVSDGEEPIKADALQPKGDAEKQPKDAPEKLPEAPKKPENVPLEKIEKTTGRRSALSEAEELGEGEGDGKDFDVDNKSPSSLVMESPCDSPASPAAAALPTAAAAAMQNEEGATAAAAPGHVFQDKLDLFLKQARSNVEKNSPPQKTKPAKLPKTPLALSHLPMSSQLEYRRLVARMNLLEKQKKRQLQQKTLPATKKVCQEAVGSGNDSDKTVLKTSNNIKVIVQTESTTDGVTNNNDSADMTVMVRKDEPLRKKVLMKSATCAVAGMKNGLKSPVKVGKKKPPPAPKLTGSPPKVPKEEELLEKFLKKVAKLSEEKKKKTLELYENHFAATSSTFLEGLDDLLVMVKNIQAEKIEQYRLQDELMRLQKQMRATEEALAQKKGIIQKLTPKMTSQHKDILKHRNKCVTLNKMCLKLGQMVQGTKYILPNNTKKKLMDKFKILAAETKRLKEIQSNDGAKGGSSDEAPKDVAKVNVPKDPKEKQQQVQDGTISGGQAEKTHNSYKSPLDHMNSKPSTFLEGLDDLLVMVKNIQAEKIEQYRLQDELMRLQKQMRATEEALAQKKGIIQKLTPKMTSQHKDILKHRNKCVTLNKMCLKLGQMVQGTKYILPNNTKKKLMDKFKILAAETKRLKEIQSNDGAKGGSSDEAPKDVAKVNVPKDPKEKQQQVQEGTISGGQAEKTHNSYKSPLDHMNSKPTANPDAVVCPFDLMGKCEDPECRFSHLNGIGQTSGR